MIKHLIFDLHDVLVDPEIILSLYETEYVRIFTKLGINQNEAKNYHKEALRWWMSEVKSIYNRKTEQTLEEMQELDQKYEEKIITNLTKHLVDIPQELRNEIESRNYEFRVGSSGDASFPETRKVLMSIQKEFPDIDLIVASNAHTSHVKGSLVGANIASFFNKKIGYDKIGYMKSHWKYWTKLLDFIDGSARDSIFIGDSQIEAEYCLALGIQCILIDRKKKLTDLRNLQPYTASILKDLKNLVSTLNLITKKSHI